MFGMDVPFQNKDRLPFFYKSRFEFVFLIVPIAVDDIKSTIFNSTNLSAISYNVHLSAHGNIL